MAWFPGWYGFGWGKGGWGRGRGWMGPWPGRGPFSYLPPWQRPGWYLGRGACRWLYPWWGYLYYITPYTTPYYPVPTYAPTYWLRLWWGW